MSFHRALATLALLLTPALALAADVPLKSGKDAFGGWHDDAPGTRRLIKPGDLPDASSAGETSSNPADVVARPAGAKPRLPGGFTAELVAEGLRNPRALRVAPNGDLLVADSMSGRVLIFRLKPGSATVEKQGVLAKGLNRPYGIAFYPPGPSPQWVYIANTNGVVRFPYADGDLEVRGKPETMVSGLPTGGHWTRDIAFAPDGSRLYVAVGSGSNIAEEMAAEPPGGLASWQGTQPLGAAWDTEARRADVLSFTPEGKDERIVATGLRNCAGLAIAPSTGRPWCVVNERDLLGDNTPFDYLTEVREGAFYGWPWLYIGDHKDTRVESQRPDLAGKVSLPDVLFQAHSAPLGVAFYTGDAFPPEYKGDAFVTLHGSWNRGLRSGYKVVRARFENGKPTGEYQDFMTGFVLGDDQVWGRPVGVAMGKDGALYVSEDGNGSIWRVTYRK